MKIEMLETIDYSTRINVVETFEAGKEYDVSDSAGKSLINAKKARRPSFIKKVVDKVVKPTETKAIKPETTKQAPKRRGRKPKASE